MITKTDEQIEAEYKEFISDAKKRSERNKLYAGHAERFPYISGLIALNADKRYPPRPRT